MSTEDTEQELAVQRLNVEVTTRIQEAENLPQGTSSYRAACAAVLDTELGLAQLLGPENTEGRIARHGTITAAAEAGMPRLALYFCETWSAGADPETREYYERALGGIGSNEYKDRREEEQG